MTCFQDYAKENDTGFYTDVAYKKRLAASARKRKVGSKSKYCGLPSDKLTAKQWRERNGKVESYKLNEPMTWREFIDVPHDLQNEYLRKLQREYGANGVKLSEMFGVSRNTVGKYIKDNNLSFEFKTGNHMGKEGQEKWMEFLTKPSENCIRDDTYEEATEETPLEELLSEDPVEMPAEEDEDTTEKMRVSSVSLVFDGILDVDNIANSLRFILGRNKTGKISINCEIEW